MPKFLKWLLIPIGIVILAIVFFKFFVLQTQFKNYAETNLPKFIKANFVDPKLVTSVSKFRSGAGHSNPGWPETCRSMKHYVSVYDADKQIKKDFDRNSAPPTDYAIDVVSPVDGSLQKTGTGEGDDQINISVAGQPGFSLRFEHVHLLAGIGGFNAKVKAGQKFSTVWNGQNFDVSVYYHYIKGDELFSYFEVLPDNLFASWQGEGATDPSEFIFTKEYRDANPLKCANNRPNTPDFLDAGGKVTENWIAENFVYLKSNEDLQKLYEQKKLQ